MKLGNPKNPVMASWLRETGQRLGCSPFLSGGIEARKTLEHLDVRKDDLQSLTLGGLDGIFHAGRERRTWVESEEYGVLFMGSRDILAANLSLLPLISKKQVRNNPRFTVHEKYAGDTERPTTRPSIETSWRRYR